MSHFDSKSSPSEKTSLVRIDIDRCTTRDAGKLLSLRRKVQQNLRRKKPADQLISKLEKHYSQSQDHLSQRKKKLPKVSFPPSLPVSEEADPIAELIKSHQVVVIAGETGSGKTTQLPKICLKAGVGVRGLIGHTQPRRVAATSVASRIAEELNCPLGTDVGVSVRFFEKTSPDGYIKVMTDGMLLTEIQRDPFLSHYEAIIIDEAHERSINIDFLLGLLKELIKKRKDLKVIITSATIDVERFSKFFNEAPIVNVEGRTYPVDIQYFPADPNLIPYGERPEIFQVQHAVKAAVKEGPGDILIFLPGEGEIRQVTRQLRKLNLSQTTILPLYARLSIGDQQKVFKPAQGRKIVLATNVAETSLTVPGIRFVIDPGTARISRFSMRSKIQRLQVEKISQASANQRAGRCGRVSAGICYRLYDEQDFDSRLEFTLPEIKRTNLASVILQMKSMGIDEPQAFPFIENAEDKHWRDGMTLLFELGALDKDNQLTEMGRSIAKMPVDPKLAAMLYSGRESALQEMLVIASLYSVRDPRERPHDKAQKADQAHAQWNDKKSDFATFLNVWNGLHKEQEARSNREFKEYCFEHFINFPAWLDWRNTYRQLKQLMQDMGFKIKKNPADYEGLHRALIPALLPNIITKTTEVHYQGARNTKVFIHPSSVNFKNKPAWLLSAELMETGKLYARATAPIEVEWIESAAEHISKVTYLDPHWRKNKGEAAAYLQKSLFGLIIVANRLVSYSDQDPVLSRQWLIEKGLIDGEMKSKLPCFLSNQKLLNEYRDEETRQRRTDILKSDEELVEFFDDHLPKSIVTQKALERWVKKDWHARNQQLTLTENDVLNPEAELDESAFPKYLLIRGSEIKLEYRFEPGHEDDGVSVCLPVSMLKQFKPSDFEWLVPGLLQEKILCSIKALPKAIRKNFIPAPEYAQASYERLKDKWGEGEFFQELATVLYQISGIRIDIDLWKEIALPAHLTPNFKIFGDGKQPIRKGRNLEELQQLLDQQIKQSLQNITTSSTPSAAESRKPQIEKLTAWPENDEFPLELQRSHQRQKTRILQALCDRRDHVTVIGCESKYQAEEKHAQAICRLVVLSLDKTVKYFQRSWQNRKELTRLSTLVENYNELIDDMAMAVVAASLPQLPIENRQDFDEFSAQVAESFTEQMNEQLTHLLSLLKQTQVISKKVYEKVEPRYLKSYQDIRSQLDDLWFEGCLFEHGLQHLSDFGRYLSALERRLDRMEVNFPREEASLREFSDIKLRILSIPDSPHNKDYSLAKKELFWMLQEYRISLFAQGIKTAYPISEKRLLKQMDSLRYLD
ncbi:ATP-dependent RNA helicase HrpA [Pleionea sediminis]|uniref:ATP-dependent RNA helicase HrpA n=1 Tax=Pleionea sediminis TaxID=2569479 RepID=UPI0011871079|nr:ATP-dependent RNA helicase HrpA [Pleionea sediminis]